MLCPIDAEQKLIWPSELLTLSAGRECSPLLSSGRASLSTVHRVYHINAASAQRVHVASTEFSVQMYFHQLSM